MIDVKNLFFSYKSHEVLKDVSFTVGAGEFIALLGPNGAGKTTLFRCILGFLKDYSGSITCDGAETKNISAKEMAKHIAYIPQSSVPVFNHTVLDVVLMGVTGQMSALSTPGKKERETAEAALEKLGVAELKNRGYRALSGGEAQLVLIARAIAQGAKHLIMDEPASSLDLGNRHRVLSLARTLSREGYTVLMSLHDPEQALVFANRAVMLQKGQIIADGAADEIITEKLIKDVYGVAVKIAQSNEDFRGVMYPPPEG